MTKLAFLLLTFALVLTSVSARAAGRRVALLHGDPELQRALALALAAWDVETVALDLRFSEEHEAEARAQVADLALRLQLEGVVWISLTPQGSRLAVFDSHTGELTVRNLPEVPPFASATAASLALSVKTALRPSVEPVSEPPSEPPPARAPLPKPPQPMRAVPVAVPPSARASLRGMLEVAWLASSKAEARAGLGTTLWFGPRRRVGAALQLSGGTGAEVNVPGFEGRYREFTLGLGSQWRWLDKGSVSSAVGLGAVLRAAILDGTASGSNVAVTRYNPGVAATFEVDAHVAGAWFVGLHVSSTFFGRYQRFLVAGQPVFEPFRLSPSAGASLGIALF